MDYKLSKFDVTFYVICDVILLDTNAKFSVIRCKMFQTLSVPGFVSLDFSYQILQVFERLGWNKTTISDHRDPFNL